MGLEYMYFAGKPCFHLVGKSVLIGTHMHRYTLEGEYNLRTATNCIHTELPNQVWKFVNIFQHSTF